MKAQPSQPTLGLLRQIIEKIPPKEILTPYEMRKFWKNILFDSGFPPAIIDVAATYDFEWENIIRDLFSGKFGDHNSYFSNAVPPYFCEQTLQKLIVLGLRQSKGTRLGTAFRQSLASDGILPTATAEVDSSVPAELEGMPGKNVLVSDVQARLDQHELVSVLFMDLDGFKAVNDTLGHAEGDLRLVRAVGIMGEVILGKGKLYRYGGDEFVAVLPNFNCEEAASTAERIRASVGNGNPQKSPRVTVSIGVVDSKFASGANAQALIGLADKRMYLAKKTGDRVVTTD